MSSHSSQSLGFQGKIYKARFSLGYVMEYVTHLYLYKSKGKCEKYPTSSFPTFPSSTVKNADQTLYQMPDP